MKAAKAVQSRHPSPQRIRRALSAIKQEALRLRNEDLAKSVWCYEEIVALQESYWNAFRCLRSARYYEAWCLYEQVELALRFLLPHFKDKKDEFCLAFIEEQTAKFQSLFPYKVFFSTGVLNKAARCSICKAPVRLRQHCHHVLGEIYAGEMCCREVTECSLIEISIVQNPVHKYAVAFLVDPAGKARDHYDYRLIFYVLKGLASPFHGWDIEWMMRRQPHARFGDVRPEEKCPCDSEHAYGECCLLEEGVLRPHAIVDFEVPPPNGLPSSVYGSDWTAPEGVRPLGLGGRVI